ncbi:MAG: DNA gyrase inhibitor YacG [Thermodesulfovibrio sp.]|nr:DNA gyrase inhibitor YacG [Thermodesulfovibrio sp.]
MFVICPNCGKYTVFKDNPWRPFCSKACKVLDLWNWLNGVYSIKIEEVEESIKIKEVNNDKNDSMWCSRKNGQ